MRREDVMKKMAAVKTAVESQYPGIKAKVQLNEWEKPYICHRLYINLVIVADVNGKEKAEKADFGFINLTTNRYNVKGGYDMRHFDADELTPAKMLYEYAEAYKTADDDNRHYVARPGCTDILNVKPGKILSRKEMLDKSFEMWVLPDNFDTYWDAADAVNCAQAAQAAESKEGTEIGRYDGHTVTISPSAGKFVVEDDGKYTGDYGRDRSDGIYWASMYLYDKMSEGHAITVLSDDAWDYIVENAAGLRVSLDIETETRTIKKGE